MNYTVRDRLEYGGVRAFQMFLGLFPLRVAFAFAWVILKIVFLLFRPKRGKIGKRIRQVFGPQTTQREIDRIAWLSLRNMIFNMIEMMRADRFDKAWIDRHMPDYGPQIPMVKDLIKEYGGLVIAVPHFGNWDLAAVACRIYDIDLIAIAAKQRNPLLNAWINRTRTHGTRVIERGTGSAMLQIVKHLKSGGALAILPDLSRKVPDTRVEFLGGTANVADGMARFAYMAGVPVLAAAPHRVGWTHFHFEIITVVKPNPAAPEKEELLRITQEVMSGFDREIRKYPGQWFWFNKRWILTEVEEEQS